ncbi:putative polyamine transporter [Quercus suber]|uniref:Polyamine transporter n=1 Tax=Quercus suber TaxID=58331 RepID=A0AAW0IPS7_QUESU|nr:probable polyamine transporter At3g13620 [Quercus suber]
MSVPAQLSGMPLEFASFLWLRRKLPTVKRPFVVPMGLPWLGILCLIPSRFLLCVMEVATKTIFLVAALLTLVGIAWYFLMNFCKSEMWLEFNNAREKLEDQDLE